jgi:hypothetical protein
VIVASYERDLANPECLFPVVPKSHRINNTRNHYLDAPHNTAHHTAPQVTRPTRQSP